MLGRTIPAISRPPSSPLKTVRRRPVWMRVLVVLGTVALLAGGSWYIWLHEPSPSPGTRSATGAAVGMDSGPPAVRSGASGFSIRFPDGWTNLQRLKGSDVFVLPGEAQPRAAAGQRAMVTDVTDIAAGPYVLRASIGEQFPAPRGEATDMIFGSGNDLLSGKRYVMENGPAESGVASVTQTGLIRTYTYVFGLGGPDGSRELRVEYNVYASDPQDMAATVDGVVRSIRRTR